MTVIAFKDGVMAADTLAQDGQTSYRIAKLMRMQDGGVVGFCGITSAGYALAKWIAEGGSLEGSEEKKLLPDLSGAYALIAKPDGSLWMIEERFPAWPLLNKSTAIGCGANACQVALSLGQSAVDAVRAVARFDLCVGDPVQSMEVEQPHEYGALKTHPKRAPAKKKRK